LSKIIGIAGKGGVGKSTFSSILIRNLSKNNDGIILAVDADSNSTLAQMLGVEIEQTIGDLREDLLNEPDNIPAGMSKFDFVKYQLQLAMTEGDKFDLVTMGRPEGPGCYCYINNILRTYMDALTDKYSYVVIDNEAGMEHLSRRTTREMDKFFIITDFTPIGLETAERIRELSTGLDLKIKDVYLIINRIPNSNENPQDHPKIRELEEAKIYSKIFYIYNDDKLIEHVFDGKSLLELNDSSPLVKSVDNIIKNTSLA
jgi:CO dehydrogenase maturation factor